MLIVSTDYFRLIEEKADSMMLNLKILLLMILTLPSIATAKNIIFCLGDSLTAGYGIEKQQAYPALLQHLLVENNVDASVINAGINGSTTASGLGRLRWNLRGRDKANIVILALGANDGLRGLDLDVTKQNLLKTIHFAKQKGIKVLLAGLRIPSNYGDDYSRKFKQLFEDVAKQEQLPMIPFLLDGVATNSSLNLADGIHPNAKGHKVMVKTVFKYLEPLL